MLAPSQSARAQQSTLTLTPWQRARCDSPFCLCACRWPAAPRQRSRRPAPRPPCSRSARRHSFSAVACPAAHTGRKWRMRGEQRCAETVSVTAAARLGAHARGASLRCRATHNNNSSSCNSSRCGGAWVAASACTIASLPLISSLVAISHVRDDVLQVAAMRHKVSASDTRSRRVERGVICAAAVINGCSCASCRPV